MREREEKVRDKIRGEQKRKDREGEYTVKGGIEGGEKDREEERKERGGGGKRPGNRRKHSPRYQDLC
jgi:hypothetical protein